MWTKDHCEAYNLIGNWNFQAPRRGNAMTDFAPRLFLDPLAWRGAGGRRGGPDGVLYTGLADGRVFAVAPEDKAVREIANTGGRPLGLEATADGRLLICDSPKGLLELDLKTGALKTLVARDGAEPLIFCSNVVAAPDGDLFFTVSSMRYTVHDWRKDIVENIPTGRVYRRAADGALTRLMHGLRFANGLVRTRDGKSLIVAETAGRRLIRLRLAGSRRRDIRGDCRASRLSRQSRPADDGARLGRPCLGTEPGAREPAQTAALSAQARGAPSGRRAAQAVARRLGRCVRRERGARARLQMDGRRLRDGDRRLPRRPQRLVRRPQGTRADALRPALMRRVASEPPITGARVSPHATGRTGLRGGRSRQ